MCGIAGAFDTRDRVDLGRLHLMARTLRHRGPDDEGIALVDPRGPCVLTLGGPDTPAGVHASGHRYAPGRWEAAGSADGRPAGPAEARFQVGLVHRRLSILDLSPAGHQPMCDADGECWITYNGEVYNHVELRADLERDGARFTSGSDTEVILAAYRRHGRDCLARFNGMFAFALWDGRRRELFCARDRFGVKPFYYQWDGARFAFASEPKALVLTQERRPAPRLSAIRDLLALDWVDHEAGTFFEDLWQLPAGHFLVIGAGGFEQRRWWGIDPARRATGAPEDWSREFRRLFADAVAIRLRADVEVGSCLSGGLDSSAVVTTASRLAARPLHAFTCAYDAGPAYDERAFVRAVCEATGARSHVVVPDGGDFWPTFDRIAAAQDEPTAGSGVYSQWKVMELAAGERLKVLLDGQGGDETLGGYFRYLPVRLRDLLAAGRLGAFRALWGPTVERLGARTALALTLEPWLPAAVVRPLRRRYGQGKDRVLSAALRRLDRPPGGGEARAPAGFASAFSRQLAFDTLRRLLPSLLRYEDRNSMAFAIETRLPFLDYRLVEFVFSLPDDQRLDGATTKAILRRSLREDIPRVVLERRDKMGFETPADAWLRGGHRRELTRRLLAAGPLHEWVEGAALRNELESFLSGRRPIGLQIWRWLALESWARQYIAVDPRRAGPALEAGPHSWPRREPSRGPRLAARGRASSPAPR